MPTVLVVDDDPGILDVVSYAFRSDGFDVLTAADSEAAEGLLAQGPDAIVLDLMLPGASGIDLCKTIRNSGNFVPIVMLTAKDAEVDRIVGLELGADDYVTKPFSARELVSRVRAILRRRDFERAEIGDGIRHVGDIKLDFRRFEVTVGGRAVRLTPSEFRLLAFLAQDPERVFSRREIMEHLWASEHVGDQHACDVHISNIRRKIEEDPVHPERLVTVRGFGYRLVAT